MDDMRIIIGFDIDKNKEKLNINAKLSELEAQINKLKISIDIDQNAVKTFQELSKNIGNVTNSLKNDTNEVNKHTQSVKEATRAENEWQIAQQKHSERTGNTTTTYANKYNNDKEIVTKSSNDTLLDKVTVYNPALDEKLANQVADGREKALQEFQKSEEKKRQIMVNTAHEEALLLNKQLDQYKEYLANQDRVEAEAHAKNLARNKQLYGDARITDQRTAYNAAIKEDQLYTEKRKVIEENYEQWWLKSLKTQEDAEAKAYQKRLSDLQNFQSRSESLAKNLTRRYGTAIDVNGLNQQLSVSHSLGVDDPDLSNKMKQVSNGFKDIESNAKTARSNFMSFNEQLAEAMRKFPVWIAATTLWMGSIHLIVDGIKSLTEIDAKMAGYVQTNEAYFTSQQKVNAETEKFIKTTHALGVEIGDVLEAARLYGRMYKDVGVVQELVRQSTKLSTVDLVSLQDATKGMEAILAQYQVQLKNVNDAQVLGNQLLDSFSKVAHDSAIPARDLLVAFERMGSVAHDTGVSVDFMNGLLASGFRNTALSGENLGNMWKTVLGNLHSDKAVSELEKLGVATKEVVNGTEQWRKAEDIILDLSAKVIGQNGDLTKSYENIARGVYQYQKLAASLDLGSIIQAQAASINSTGSTTEYLKTQMETIERKANQVKASLQNMFNTAGDDGLRSSIKAVLDVVDQFLIGLTNMSKGSFQTIAVLGLLATAYLGLKSPIANLITAIRTLIVEKAAVTAATVAETGALETATVTVNAMTAAEARAAIATTAWTGGISLAVAALATYVFSLGESKKKEEELADTRNRAISIQEQQYSQYTKQIDVIPKWVSIHNDLVKAINSGTLSAEGQIKAKNDLEKVSKALADTIGQEGYAQLKAADFTDEATKKIVTSLNQRKIALKESIQDELTQASTDISNKTADAQKKKDEAEKKLSELEAKANKKDIGFGELGGGGGLSMTNTKADISKYKKQLSDADKNLDDLKQQAQDTEGKLITVQEDLLKLNNLGGSDGKSISSGQSYDEAKSSFQSDMEDFNHLVNMQADGYTDASGQIEKLKQIKDKYKGELSDKDLYSLDEEIYRAQNDIAKKAKGFSSTSSASVTPYDQTDQAEIVNPYSRILRGLDSDLKKSESLQNNMKDSSKEFRNELEKQIEIYKKKQAVVHQEADDLRASNAEMQSRLATERLSQKEQNKLLKAIDDNENKIAELGSSWFDYENSATEANKKITDSVDKELQAQYDHSKKWIEDQKALQNLTLDEELAAWERVQARYAEGTEQRIASDKEIADVEKRILDERKKLATETVDLIKKTYETQKNAEIDDLDKSVQAYKDATQAKIDEIDRLRAAQDYNSNLNKDDKKLQEIQNQINAYSLDDSNEAKSKVIELKKQLADQQEKIQKEQQDYSDKLVKDDLQNKQKTYEEDVKNQKEAVTQKYDNLINDDQKWLKIENDIISGHVTDVQNTMKGLIDGLGTYANTSMGKVSKHAAEIKSLIGSLNIGSTALGTMSPMSAGNYTAQNATEEQIINTMKQNSDKYKSASSADKTSLHDANVKLGDQIGATYNGQTGKWYKADLPLYHNGGEVGGSSLPDWLKGKLNLAPNEVAAILKKGEVVLDQPANFLTNFAKRFMPDFSSIMPKLSTTPPVNNVNLNLGGITITGDKQGGYDALNVISNGLKKMGVNINRV